jgi:hypothetical protein
VREKICLCSCPVLLHILFNLRHAGHPSDKMAFAAVFVTMLASPETYIELAQARPSPNPPPVANRGQLQVYSTRKSRKLSFNPLLHIRRPVKFTPYQKSRRNVSFKLFLPCHSNPGPESDLRHLISRLGRYRDLLRRYRTSVFVSLVPSGYLLFRRYSTLTQFHGHSSYEYCMTSKAEHFTSECYAPTTARASATTIRNDACVCSLYRDGARYNNSI